MSSSGCIPFNFSFFQFFLGDDSWFLVLGYSGYSSISRSLFFRYYQTDFVHILVAGELIISENGVVCECFLCGFDLSIDYIFL